MALHIGSDASNPLSAPPQFVWPINNGGALQSNLKALFFNRDFPLGFGMMVRLLFEWIFC